MATTGYSSYEEACAQHRWEVPARYNMGVDTCDRWAERQPGRTAILNVRADGSVETVSYGAATVREVAQRAGVEVERIAVLASVQPRGFLPGALLDAGILVDVYLAMTGGQRALILGEEEDNRVTTAVERG